jgi:RNA polymerase sigma-70 factor (ECF subfamily)
MTTSDRASGTDDAGATGPDGIVIGGPSDPVPLPAVRFRQRDSWAGHVELVVEAAFDRHAEALKAFALAAARDGAAADDLVQETFVRLIRELRERREPDNLRAWLFRVCANLAVSQARRRAVSDRFRARLVDRSSGSSPEQSVIRREEDAGMLRALGHLRPDERAALLLAASGFNMTEVGEAFGRTPNATRAFVCRARIRLRRILEAEEAPGR